MLPRSAPPVLSSHQGAGDDSSLGLLVFVGRGIPWNPLRLPASVSRIPRRGIPAGRDSAAGGLAGAGRMGLRPTHVSAFCRPVWPRIRLRLRLSRIVLDRGKLHVDSGLPARRPALLAGAPPPDAHPGPIRGAARQPGRRRRLRLALALRRATRPLAIDRRPGPLPARISACAAASSWPTISGAPASGTCS